LLLCLSAALAVAMISCDLKGITKKVMYNRARNLHDHGKIKEAIEVYKKVLESDGDNTEVHYDLGVAYTDDHDVNNANKQVAILRKLNRLDLSEVLATVIRDSDSSRVRKKLQTDYDSKK